jgi:sulfur-carrier protein
VIRVVLPPNLRTLASVGREVQVEIDGVATQRAILDALEATYPALRGTIRDRETQRRRPLLRFFACEEDLSDEEPDAPVPEPVAIGKEPYLIVGAMSGGIRRESPGVAAADAAADAGSCRPASRSA